jgi:HAD superfamily hydrolase (TIGR01509 family)
MIIMQLWTSLTPGSVNLLYSAVMDATYPRCYIFDLDGTLALSEHIKLAATQAICKKNHIAPITEKEYFEWAGAPTKTLFRNFLERRDITLTPELLQKFIDERRVVYSERIHLIEPHEPIVSLLKALSPHYKTALVTTSNREQGLAVIRSLEISDLFDVMVFGDDVNRNKPDPECYELAAKLLEAKPEECLVFEDSESGITAAREFGAQIVKVSIL